MIWHNDYYIVGTEKRSILMHSNIPIMILPISIHNSITVTVVIYVGRKYNVIKITE